MLLIERPGGQHRIHLLIVSRLSQPVMVNAAGFNRWESTIKLEENVRLQHKIEQLKAQLKQRKK
jgi:hypothetical protein